MKNLFKLLIAMGITCSLIAILSPYAPAADDEAIRIGVIYDITGKAAPVGTKQMDGAKLAIKEINARGGANFGDRRAKVDAAYGNCESRPDVAVQKMKTMIESNKITALVGGSLAHVSMAMNAQTRQTPILFCSTCAAPEEMYTPKQKGPYTITTMVGPESIGAGAASYVVERMKLKDIVVCLPDYAYGHGALKGIERVFKKYPDVKYTTILTPLGAGDMKPYLTKALETNPQIIMMGQWGSDGITILKQAHEMDLKKKTKIFYNWIANVFATEIPPEAFEGVTCQMFWYHNMEGLGVNEGPAREFTSRYRAAYGEPPDPYAASAYMGVYEVVRAMELAKSTDPEKAYNALMANPDWDSPKGQAKWMVDGNPRYKFSSFIGVGLSGSARKDPKWDYARMITFYNSKWFQKTPQELGW